MLGVVVLVLGLQVVAAWIAAHPGPVDTATPFDADPRWRAVEPGLGDGWYADIGGRQVRLVLVHGYGSGPGPLFEVAGRLSDLGYGVLVLALPYADGSEPFSGGGREAAAVRSAVDWLRDRTDVPIALVGFSAGGFASALAVAEGAGVDALVLDSAFVDAADTFVDAAARATHLPRWLVAGLPAAYPVVSGGGRLLDLADAIEPGPWTTPTMLIHGAADEIVPLADAEALACRTGGQLLVLDDRGHVDADYPRLGAYVGWIDGFVRRATGQPAPASAVTAPGGGPSPGC